MGWRVRLSKAGRLAVQIAVGALVLAMVVTMVNLGLWQLRRHDEKQELRSRLSATLELPALEIDAVLAAGSGTSNPAFPAISAAADLEYRRVRAAGELRCADAVLVRNRTLHGRPGYWVLAPLQLAPPGEVNSPPEASSPPTESLAAPFTAVMVNLGWLPRELAGADTAANPDSQPWQSRNCTAPDAESSATITGLVLLSRGGAGKECDSLTPVCTLGQPDIAALRSHYAAQSEGLAVVSGFYLQLEESMPSGSDNLAVLGTPDFDLGNHRSYAVQWFIFSAIAAGGFPLMLWRNARRRRPADPASAPNQPAAN